MEKGRNTRLQVDLFYYDMTKCKISARLLCLLQTTKRGGETREVDTDKDRRTDRVISNENTDVGGDLFFAVCCDMPGLNESHFKHFSSLEVLCFTFR